MTDLPDVDSPVFDAPPSPAPASARMAERLRVNRTGRLTQQQYRLVWLVGVGAASFLLCPLALVVQMIGVLLTDAAPAPTLGGVVFTLIGAVFVVLLLGLVGTNAVAFMGEAMMRRPVRAAQGPLQIRVPPTRRPELPFSYIVGDYSFAPYLAPRDLPMRTDAPYVVYYGAKTRLLLSIAALDAPDSAEWAPQFEQD